MLDRRDVLKRAGASVALLGTTAFSGGSIGFDEAIAAPAAGPLDPSLPQGLRDEVILDTLPGKAPLLKLSYRPPNYETPVSYFDSLYTPNDAFFVRWHLADIPEVNAAAWRLKIGGDLVETPLELSLDQLKRDFAAVEIPAVCMCSGNRRGLFSPHVPGVQWGYGALGNAKWKGARLKDVLTKAGLKKEAVEIVLNGADGPVLDKTPDLVKSLPVWKAMDENTIIAYEMNGAALPHFNGFPARIVVPGWTATYWIKQITGITAIDKPFDGYWVAKAYRIPNGKFPIVQRFITQETDVNTPITEMVVNSQFTGVTDGQNIPAGKTTEIRGIAWDGGYGIQSVEVSSDGGQSWQTALLGLDDGRFSFRQWTFKFTPPKAGTFALKARATNKIGQSQTAEVIPNPAGYHHNVMQQITVQAV